MKKSTHFLSLVIIILSFGILLSCQTGKQLTLSENSTWQEVKSSDGSTPIARHEAAFVGVGERFYLLGGRGMKPTSIYDTKTQKWSEGATPPVEIHHVQPVVWKDKIYVLGALTGGYPGEKPVPNVYIYDPAKDSWEKGVAIPEDRQRGGAGAAVYEGKIYLACGIKDGHRGDHKKWLDAFDPATGKWEKLPDAPRVRDHFQAVAADDKLYLLGGRTTIAADNPFKNTIAEVDVYDFKTGQWSTLENNLPTLRAGNYAIQIGEEIVVMGGESFTQEAAHAEMEALNLKTKNWRSLSPMKAGRHGTGVVQYHQTLYVASGSGNRGGGPELSTMEKLDVDEKK